MNMNEAKQIRIEEYLHSLGYSPVRQQGGSLWYNSPFRDEQEPSFKVNHKWIAYHIAAYRSRQVACRT